MKRRAFIGGTFCFGASGLLIPRLALAQNQSVVETAQGKVRGVTNTRGINVFKGMRYGASTAGDNRFMPPQAPPKWSGIQDAFNYGDQSPQANTRLAADEPKTDDCLRINVWTPGLDNAKRPVMLWFHGGGFEAGNGSEALYEGTNVAHRGDVVVCTINHRLNVFGHCYLGGVLGEDFQQSGNVGVLDWIASMNWGKENSTAFGGYPDNVMIYGQSGGGLMVIFSDASRRTHGVFNSRQVASFQSCVHIEQQVIDVLHRRFEVPCPKFVRKFSICVKTRDIGRLPKNRHT